MISFSTEKSVHRFADKTRRRWNFGDDCDNDVLIFLTTNDDLVMINQNCFELTLNDNFNHSNHR